METGNQILKLLTQEQIERYGRDGILTPIALLTSEEVDRFRSAVEKMEASDNRLGTGMTVELAIDESRVRDVALRPGEISLHHVNIVHGSGRNTSDRKRIGFAMRYVTPKIS